MSIIFDASDDTVSFQGVSHTADFWSETFLCWVPILDHEYDLGDIVRFFNDGDPVRNDDGGTIFEVVDKYPDGRLEVVEVDDPSDEQDEDESADEEYIAHEIDAAELFAQVRGFEDTHSMLEYLSVAENEVLDVRRGFIMLDDGSSAAILAMGDNGEGAPEMVLQIEPLNFELNLCPVVDEALPLAVGDGITE